MVSFTKMHGNGNDFIVVDNRTSKLSAPALSELARKVCRRRESIGADGLLVVEQSSEADFTMRLFNADGSEGEMCGNGARCVALYACMKGIAGADLHFHTLAGIMEARVDPPMVMLRMGKISLSGGWVDRPLVAEGRTFPSSFYTVGVPHVMVFPDTDLEREDMVRLGRMWRHDMDLFPSGANVNFVRPDGEGAISVVTYERGVEDLTDSCGTGSTASALASVLRSGNHPGVLSVRVRNPGGVNMVHLVFSPFGKDVEASLSGPAVLVAEGYLYKEAL